MSDKSIMIAHGLLFHHLCDLGPAPRHPAGPGAISGQQLRQLIRHLGSDRILPADEYLRRATRGQLQPQDRCLTFDNNLRCQYDIALPVLREHGLTAFWFVCTSVVDGAVDMIEICRHFRARFFNNADGFYTAFFEAVRDTVYDADVRRSLRHFDPATYLPGGALFSDDERKYRFVRDDVLGADAYQFVMGRVMAAAGVDPNRLAEGLWMSSANIRELHHAGHVIGLHSHTHPLKLAKLDIDEQRAEYQQNFDAVKRITGVAPTCMSHPNDSYTSATLKLLRQLGMQLGFRTMTAHEPPTALEHPRVDALAVVRNLRDAA